MQSVFIFGANGSMNREGRDVETSPLDLILVLRRDALQREAEQLGEVARR
jgi:hypothetical protein